MSNTIKERSAVANGMMPENGRHSVAYTNPFARWIMVLRGYLPTLGFDRFKAGSDFSEYKSDKYNSTSFYRQIFTIIFILFPIFSSIS